MFIKILRYFSPNCFFLVFFLFILSPSQTVFLPTLFSILSFFRFHFLFHSFSFISSSSSVFPSILLFSMSAHLRNSITPRLYIPPINILECATNSNREGEPIIRNEGINQSRVSLGGNKIEKKRKKNIATSTGAMSLSLSRLATRMHDVKSFPPIGIQQRPPRTQRSMTGSVGQIKRVTCYLGHF